MSCLHSLATPLVFDLWLHAQIRNDSRRWITKQLSRGQAELEVVRILVSVDDLWHLSIIACYQ